MIASLAIGATLAKIGKEAVNFASGLTEVQNVVDVAFGSMAWKAEQFSKNALAAFGMSELSAKKTAGTYMTMAKSAQIGEEKASDMAVTLAGLTGDVASFFNISQELADVRLKSVFTGETETLKELGVVMTQVNLKAYAMSQGITKNIEDMNQVEQTTLRYNFVLDRLSFVQGDFARTSGSWANQVRLLKENFRSLLGIIGNGLIAALTPVVKFLNMIIGKLITFANVVSAVFGRLFGKKSGGQQAANGFTTADNAAKGATASTGGLNNALKGTEGQAKKTAKALGSLAGFDELNIINASDSGSGADSGADSGGIGGGGYAVDPIDWDSAFPEPDTSGINRAVNKAMAYIDKFKVFFEKHKTAILAILAGIMAGLITFFGFKWLISIGGITGILTKLLDIPGVQFVVEGFLGIFRGIPIFFGGIFGKIISVITGSRLFSVIQAFFAPIVSLFGGVFSSIGAMVGTGISFVTGLFSSFVTAIGGFVSSIMEMPIIGTVIQTIIGFVTTLCGWLGSLFTGITTVLGVIVSSPALLATVVALMAAAITQLWMTNDDFRNKLIKAWDNIKSTLQSVWDNVIKPIFDAIAAICISVWEKGIKPLWEAWVEFVGVIISIMANLWNGISPILNKILDVLGPIFKQVLGVLAAVFSTTFNTILSVITVCFTTAAGTLEGFFSSIDEIFGGIKRILNGLIDFITGVFTGNWRQAWNGVKDIFAGIFSVLAGLVKAPINAVIGIINGAISGINKIGFEVPDWIPFIGGKKFKIDVPKMAYLAQGGVVSKATPAIFGEAGTEAVIPLKRNTQGLDLIAEKLGERLSLGDNGGNGATYVINFVLENGKVLTKMVIDNIKEYEVQTGKPVFDY